MKMKKACEATGLTERAIRLYLSKNLIAPSQVNGMLDFSPEDIQQLRDIAVLRQFDFTLEQIAAIVGDAGGIGGILQCRLELARAERVHNAEVCDVLGQLDAGALDGLHAVAEGIRARRMASPEPDFCRFDEITDEERQQQRLVAIRELSRQERRTGLLRGLMIAAGVIAVIAAVLTGYLQQVRIRGYISLSPLTIEAIHTNKPFHYPGDEQVTIRTENTRAIEMLGRDTITVPCRVFGLPFQEGDRFESACQLIVELRNIDLARMDINPLQTMHTRREEVNQEWLRYVLQTFFDQGYGHGVKLSIQEYTGFLPLLSAPGQ